MKDHSPSRTYNPGDRCRIVHSVNGVVQYYTFEAIGITIGTFQSAVWRNVTPRVWRLVSLDIDGFVYQGDTIYVGNVGHKNTSNGIQLIREFINIPKQLGLIYPVVTSIYAEQEQEYYLGVENIFIDDFGRNTTPNWSKQSNREVRVLMSFISEKIYLKITTVDAPICFLSGVTPDPHQLVLFKGAYSSWNLISTPDIGSSGSDSITYNLSGTPDDFQYFIITNIEGVLSVQKLAVNVNI